MRLRIFCLNLILLLSAGTLLGSGWLAYYRLGDQVRASSINPLQNHAAAPLLAGIASAGMLSVAGLKLRRTQKLRRKLREWKGAFDAVQDPMWVMDNELQIQCYNVAAASLFGRAPEDILGHRCCELVHGTPHPIARCPQACMFQMGERATEEVQIGSRWFLAVLDPVYEDEEIIGCVHILKDITRKRTEREEIRDNVQRLAAHNENSPLAIIEMDSSLKITCWAGAAEKIFGWKADEVLGKPINILGIADPEGVQMLPAIELLRHQATEPTSSHSSSGFGSHTKSGTFVYCDWHNTVLRDSVGRVTSVRCLILNITVQKEAEATREKLLRELDAERALLETVLQQMPVGVVIKEANTGKIRRNELSTKILGITQSDNPIPPKFLRPGGEIIPPEQRPLARALLNAETVRAEEIQFYRKDGTRVHLDVNAAPVFDSQGAIAAAVEIFTDITGRKQTEESLRLSEERFRAAILNSPVNVSSQDLNLRYTWICNPQLGYAPSAMIGKTDMELFPIYAARQLLNLKREVLLSGNTIRRQVAFVFDRAPVCFDVTIEPLHDQNGTVTGVLNVVVDVTENRNAQDALRKSEANYRRLVENANEGIWTIDRQGLLTYVNSWMADLFGYSPEEMLGQPLTKFMFKEQVPQIDRGCAPFLSSPRKQWDQHFLHKNGTGFWVLASCCPLQDESGDFAGVLGFFTDITQRKLREVFRNAINAVHAEIHSDVQIAQILERTVSIASQAIGSESAAISLRRDERWEISHVFGLPKSFIGLSRSDQEETPTVLARDSKGPIAVDDVANDSRLQNSFAREMGVRSMLVVPLLTQYGAIGAIYYNFHAKAFSFEQAYIDFASQLAASFALAMDNARLFSELQQELAHRLEVQQQILTLNSNLEKQVQNRTAELQDANNQLREEILGRRRLEEEILQVSEAEQKRLGQDLHDDLGQQLTGISMFSSILEKSLKKAANPYASQAEELSRMLRETIQTSRRLAKGFYPIELERGGLLMALLDLTQRITTQTQIACEFRHDDSFKFPQDRAIHLYRIAQEAINNSVKHGKPRNILVECTSVNQVSILRIMDDGIGLKPSPTGSSGMGLDLVQYRARLVGAKIEVTNREGGGCQVTCTLLPEESSQSATG